VLVLFEARARASNDLAIPSFLFPFPQPTPTGLLIFGQILAAYPTLQGKGCALGLGVPAFLRCASCNRAMPLRSLALPL
jgi:hypothetical protein